jgi:hypothetical protein
MVGWTNFGVTQSIFLPPKCGSNYYIVLSIILYGPFYDGFG